MKTSRKSTSNVKPLTDRKGGPCLVTEDAPLGWWVHKGLPTLVLRVIVGTDPARESSITLESFGGIESAVEAALYCDAIDHAAALVEGAIGGDW